MQTIKVVSLFSGCGGADYGLTGNFSYMDKTYEDLGYDVVWANDIGSILKSVW